MLFSPIWKLILASAHDLYPIQLSYLQDVISPSFRGSGPPINTVKDQPVRAASAVKNWRKTAGQSSIALHYDG
jgi:hypothetical protein